MQTEQKGADSGLFILFLNPKIKIFKSKSEGTDSLASLPVLHIFIVASTILGTLLYFPKVFKSFKTRAFNQIG